MKYIQSLILALLLSTAFATISYAQTIYAYDRFGHSITRNEAVLSDGSPFLVDKWQPGMVKLANGQTYENVALKYNLKEDVLYFKGNTGDMMTFVQPVTEFSIAVADSGMLVTKHYRNGYKNIGKTTSDSYFEILTDGKVQLLKRTTKVEMKKRDFNVIDKTIIYYEEAKYYLVKNDKPVAIKNDKKSVLANLTDKQQQINDFINANNPDFESDFDLARLINYYNSL
jgi:hypothetical protein